MVKKLTTAKKRSRAKITEEIKLPKFLSTDHMKKTLEAVQVLFTERRFQHLFFDFSNIKGDLSLKSRTLF